MTVTVVMELPLFKMFDGWVIVKLTERLGDRPTIKPLR
jgi:hypothetical protein